MIVYADVLVVLNLFVNYFLLRLSARILKTKPKRVPILLGAMIGGVYALVIFLPEQPWYIAVPMQLAVLSGMVLCAFRPHSIKAFLREAAAFFLVNFLFAGFMLAVFLLFKPKNMVYQNNAVYFDISIVTLVLSAVGCYLLFTWISYLLKRRTPDDRLYTVCIAVNGKAFTGTGLLDTGNTLSDGFSDMPVVIADKAVLRHLLCENYPDFENGTLQNDLQFRLIPYTTVGGEGVLKAFRAETLEIVGKGIAVNGVLVAESRTDFHDAPYDILLSPKLFEERFGETHANAQETARTH